MKQLPSPRVLLLVVAVLVAWWLGMTALLTLEAGSWEPLKETTNES